jgi:ribose transport system ATP-binding protein
VLAKWLQRAGKVVLFDEPTQGVDVEAKTELFALIRGLAEEGRAVIVISSDFAELAQICTRVVVLREGQVSGVLEGDEISEDALVRLAYAPAGTSPSAPPPLGAVSPA